MTGHVAVSGICENSELPPVQGRRAFDSGAENILNYTSMSVLAYVDPSVMSYTVQAIAGVAIALGVVFGVVWRRLKKGANKALGRDENAGKEIEDEIIRK